MKKRKLNYFKISLAIAIVLIIVVVLFFMFNNDSSNVIDKIKDYGYSLKDNTSSYHKQLFKDLKDKIEDEQEYAKLLGKLFISDFYTLEGKRSKVDIGGVQFIYEGYQEEFVKYASSNIYKIVSSSSEDLPLVTKIEIEEFGQKEFGHIDSIYDPKAFFITYSITYKKQLEDELYPEVVELVIIRNNDRLEIVEMNSL